MGGERESTSWSGRSARSRVRDSGTGTGRPGRFANAKPSAAALSLARCRDFNPDDEEGGLDADRD
jgi:hypothetical protein